MLFYGIPAESEDFQPPRSLDPIYEVQLFAEAPMIRTPIGLEVDSRGRVIVIESHTHLRPQDYEGPEKDRILALTDTDGDGKADESEVLVEGLQAAMNLAIDRDDNIFVVCAKEVWALVDENKDGKPDRSALIVEVETNNNYPHSALLGIEVAPDGWVYISRGNNGSMAYRGLGTDGSVIQGFGDGGAIWRCHKNGTNLHEFATGFWNPFDLTLDHYNRLVAVDNDPDARGPNRLVHVINGGYYGYRSVMGEAGTHPLQSWNGEIPGTLPYAAALGEAPSGILDASFTSIPEDWADSYFVSLWNENRIVRVETRPRGASFEGESKPWIIGGNDFRPVGLAASRQGELYISDWADVAYPNHGKGRIWKVVPVNQDHLKPPLPQREFLKPDLGTLAMNQVLKVDNPFLAAPVYSAAESEDPFLQHVASLAMTKKFLISKLDRLLNSPSPSNRLTALLTMKRVSPEGMESQVARFLKDPDEDIRIAALAWAADAGMVDLLDDIQLAVGFQNVSQRLLEVYIATTEFLDLNFLEKLRLGEGKASRIPRRPSSAHLIELIGNERRPAEVRAKALRLLQLEDQESYVQGLKALSISPPEPVQKAAIELLAKADAPDVESFIWLLVESPNISESLRADCLNALSEMGVTQYKRLEPWLQSEKPYGLKHRIALLDSVCSITDLDIRERFLKKLLSSIPDNEGAKVKEASDKSGVIYQERLKHALKELNLDEGDQLCLPFSRPQSLEEWMKLAELYPGSRERGRDLFLSNSQSCVQCHDRRKGSPTLGPALVGEDSALNVEQALKAILDPDKDFSPQYQAWYVDTVSGLRYLGTQLDHRDNGAIQLILNSGSPKNLESSEIGGYGILNRSLMPAGLENGFSITEFLDLIAWLSNSE